MKHTQGTLSALLALVALLLLVAPVRADRVFSGDIGLAAGWTGEPTQVSASGEHAESAVGLLRLRCQPRGCQGFLELKLRHPFCKRP